MESAGERLFGILIYLSTSGPIGSGAPGAPNPGGPGGPGVRSSPEGLRENLRICVRHQFGLDNAPYVIASLSTINRFMHNSTNNTSISLKIIPRATCRLQLLVTMPYTQFCSPDPESLLSKLTDLLGFRQDFLLAIARQRR